MIEKHIEVSDSGQNKERNNSSSNKTSQKSDSSDTPESLEADIIKEVRSPSKDTKSFRDVLKRSKREKSRKPSSISSEVYKNTVSNNEELSFQDALKEIKRFNNVSDNWNKDREDYELFVDRVVKKLETSLSENIVELSKGLGSVENWVNQNSLESPGIETAENSYSFKGTENLDPSEFVQKVSEEIKTVDRLYTNRQQRLARLGKELEDTKKDYTELEDGEDLLELKGLGTNSDEILRLERELVHSQRDDIYEEARVHKKKKKEYKKTFENYSKQVENVYRNHFSELEAHVSQNLDSLKKTVKLLDRISQTSITSIEELNRDIERETRFLDDGENEIRKQYRNALSSLEVKALDHYNEIEESLDELKSLESNMDDKYFEDLKKSGKLEKKIESFTDEAFENALSNKVDRALE